MVISPVNKTRALYALNRIWLPDDEITVDIDPVRYYTIYGLLATNGQREWKKTSKTGGFYIRHRKGAGFTFAKLRT
jgi:hypothetical protein